MRVLIMVSKSGHCLNDLLFRVRSGHLDINVVAVVSNHPDLRPLTQSYGIDYHRSTATRPSSSAEPSDSHGVMERCQRLANGDHPLASPV